MSSPDFGTLDRKIREVQLITAKVHGGQVYSVVSYSVKKRLSKAFQIENDFPFG